MTSTALKFGDLVIIQGLPQADQSLRKENKKLLESGFLSALGFTDNRIFLQTVPSEEKEKLKVASNLNNYHDLIFQVWPKASYEAHKQLRKLNKEKALMAGASDEVLDAFEEKMRKVRGRVEQEKEANQLMLSHSTGLPVIYGNEIQLMHFNSKGFLTARVTCSDADSSAYKFEISEEYNSGMVLKIIPRFQIRQEGDLVFREDQVLIVSSKLDCYVNFSTDQYIEIDNRPAPSSGLPVITAPFEHRQLNLESKRYEAYISQFRDSVWKFHYYGDCKEEEEGAVVKGGDLVKIRIAEIGADLAADVPMRGRNPEVYGRKYIGEYEEEENNVNTLWEVEITSAKDKGVPVQLQNSQGKSQGIRLRHLLTGKLLSIDEDVSIAQDLKKSIAVVRGDDPQKKPSLAVFHSFTKTQSTKLHYNISYGVGLTDEKGEYRYLKTHEKTDFTTRTNSMTGVRSTNNMDPSIFKPLKEDELSTEKRVITCDDKYAHPEHALMLTKVSEEEAFNVRYVASSIATLKYFRDLLKAYTNPQNISRDIFSKVLSVLKDLIFFVQKASEKSEEIDPVTFEGIPIQEKQRTLKDFKIIELLTEILYYPFYTKFFTLDNIRHKPFKKVFQYCYRLIKHTIKEYRPNEIYAAQWLEHFMEQAMNSNADNDIKAEATLIELIDNNKRILSTKINKDMISRFVDMLEANKSQKFVNLLRALCVCDGEAVVKNQTDMSRYIIEDVNVRNNLIYQHFRKMNGVIEVRVPDYEVGVGEFWVTLPMFKKNSEDLDLGEKYNYFLSMIHLLSDLCLQRNYVAMDYLQTIYTYDICYTIVSDTSDQELGWEIKSAFAKLLVNLWIDRKPYQPLNVPRLLVLWDTLSPATCGQIACSESDVNIFEGLRGYLKTYFEKLAKAYCTKIYEVEQNKFTLIMLELADNMVRFGLYKDLVQLKELIKPLLVLLNGMRDVMTEQEYDSFKRKAKAVKKKKNLHLGTDNLEANTARYEENEETIIVMQCKNKICEILKVVLDINDDLLLRKFLLEFRNDLDLSKDREHHGDQTPDNNGSALSDNRFLFGRNSVSSPPVKSDEGTDFTLDSFPKLLNWVTKLSKHNAIELSALAPTNIVRVLFDLCLYNHDELVNNAFEVLYSTHSQRRRLIEILEQVHILEDVQNKTAVINIEKDLLVLRELAETTEKWYGLNDPHSITQSDKCMELIKRLERYLVNDTILLGKTEPEAEGFSPLASLQEKQNEEAGEVNEDAEEDDLVVDKEFQIIFKHLKVYEPMLEIIQYEISSGEDLKTKSRASVLKRIFKFLTKFVTGQKKSQNLLSAHMDNYLTLLKDYTSSGIENFVQEMFKGNRSLIKQYEKVERFSGNVMSIIRRLGVSDPESANLLLSMKSFMRVKKNVIKTNQTNILSLLTAKENSDIFLTLETDQKRDSVLEKLRTFNQQVAAKNKSSIIKIPGEIDYLSSLLEILAYTCDGKNAITESRSQTSWPLKDLSLLYENGKDCWLIKRSVLLFVYHVYLDTEKEMKEGGDLHKILMGMITDMEVVSKNFKREYNLQYHKGVIDNKIAQEKYFFGGLLPCLDDILVKKFYAGLPNYTKILKDVYRLLEDIKSLDINPEQRKEIISTLDKFKKHAQEVYHMIKAGSEADASPVREHHIERRNQRDTSGYGSTIATKEENPKNMKLKIRLAIISQHQDFLESAEREFKTMIKNLIHIEKIDVNDIYCTVIPFSDVIKSLINLVDITETTTPKEMIMIGLKMFRRIIERENKKDDKPAFYWESEQWMDYNKKIVFRQNQLCDLGIVDMICNIMSQTKDTEIQYECVLIGIALLIGGNSKVQKKILEYTQNDLQNKFLCAVSDLIERNFYIVKKEMSSRNKEYLAALNEREEELQMAMKTPSPMGIDMKALDIISPGSPTHGETKKANPLALTEKMQQEVDETTQALEILQITYRLLQLFCEGHNLQLQDQLRTQKDKNGNESGKTQNFIAKTAHCFNTLIKQINADSIDFCTQMLDFLIEATQGPCEENQECLSKAKIINSCMDFLTAFRQPRDYHKQGFLEEEQIDKVNDATTTAMKLLNTLIEGVSKPEIIEEMSRLDFRFLVSKLAQEYQDIVEDQLKLKFDSVTPAEVTSKMNANSMTQQVLESFDVYILIVTLADATPKVATFLKDTEDYTTREKDALEFFRRNVGNIEIVFNEKLLKVYFPIHSVCRYLTENTQKDFMMNVNRESPTEKINGLVSASAEFIVEMEHMAYLESQKFVISQFRFNLLRDFSTLISIAINGIILGTYYFTVVDNVSLQQIQDMGKLNTIGTINVLGYVQLVTSTLMILFWIIINGPIILTRRWGEHIKKSKGIGSEPESDEQANGEEEPDPETLPLNQVLDHLDKKGPYDSLFNQNGKRNYGHLFVRLASYWQSLIFMLQEGRFVFMLFYLTVSCLGVYSEIVYCLHILDIVNRSETLKNVVRSITHNLNQLLLTSLLGVVLIYIYSLFGFFFSDYSYFYSGVSPNGERGCSSMVQCFSSTLNYGLRNGGGVGDTLAFLSYQSETRVAYFFRLVFDLTFFILINLVFLKLIFGIIIDTFAELRDEKTTIDEDIRTNCFICNIDRYTFDKNGCGFENHTERHHLPWNYLYFIYSLSAKDSTEYNGIESYVNDKLQKEDISWFPSHRALVLEQTQE